jgi:site-specific recombinase XerD
MDFTDYLQTVYHYKQETLQMKLRDLNSWKKLCNKYQKLERLSMKDILQFIEIKQKEYHYQVINRQIQTLEQYYDYLIETGKRKDQPIHNFRIKHVYNPLIEYFFSSEELEHIYTNYPDTGHFGGIFGAYAQRNKVIIGLMVYQALDVGTMANLKVSDLDLEKAIIKVPKKTDDLFNGRILPLEGVQILAMQTYLQNTRNQIIERLNLYNNESLFPCGANTQFKQTTLSIKKKINTYFKLQDTKQIRQSRIALWLKQYGIREAQYKAGFKRMSTFNKYQKVQITSLQEAIQEYHIF